MNFLTEDEYKRKKQAEFEERNKNKFPGFEVIGIDLNVENTIKCELCDGDMVLLPSDFAAQPDKYWAGYETQHAGYVTSGSFLKRFEKQNNLERVTNKDMELVQKNAKKKKQDDLQKNVDNLNKFLEKELAPVEISNDGNTVKEQNKFNKVRST